MVTFAHILKHLTVSLLFLIPCGCDRAEFQGPLPAGAPILHSLQSDGSLRAITGTEDEVLVTYGLQGSAMVQLSLLADHLDGIKVDFNCWVEVSDWSSPGAQLQFNFPQIVVAGEHFQVVIVVLDEIWSDVGQEAVVACTILGPQDEQSVALPVTLVPHENDSQ